MHAAIGADSYYYSYNGHGDVVQLTDASGNVVRSYEYDAFGNELNPTAGDNNPFRYCGEYYDVETGSYYLRARYYNPFSGRFLTEDPIRAGFNWYAYCNSNPIAFVDPWGLEGIVVSGGYAGYEKYKYQFIETALKAIYDLKQENPDEEIMWVIANAGYTKMDRWHFHLTAALVGVNLMIIDDKQQLFDYLNTKNGNVKERLEDKITSFTLLSHGYKGILALAHGHEQEVTELLNITMSDINKLNPKAFDNPISWFGSCNTGTKTSSGVSFAQMWVNRVGGIATAVIGKTNYENINVWEEKDILDSIIYGGGRFILGYIFLGSHNMPTTGTNAKWAVFEPRF